jgi:hypothetical protein
MRYNYKKLSRDKNIYRWIRIFNLILDLNES